MHIALIIALVLSGLVWGIVNLQREVRRRQWEKKNITPLFSIEKPRDLVATLAFGLLKCGGDLTNEQKDELLRIYQDELQFSSKDAAEMYSYASYLISTDPNFAEKVQDILAPALESFTDSQLESAVSLFQRLTQSPTEAQTRFLSDVKSVFEKR